MSISNVTLFGALASSITAVEQKIQQSQQDLATGKQVNQPSDNPTAWEQSSVMTASESAISNDVSLAGRVQTRLSSADSALSQAENAITSAIQTATQGSSGTIGASQMQGLAQSVQGLLSDVLNAANLQELGSYVFGGIQTLTPPYSSVGVYSGATASNSATFSNGTSVQESFNGQAIFGDNTTGAIGALTSLGNALSAGNQSAVAATLPALQSALQQLASARTTVGAGLGTLQTMVTNSNSQLTSLQGAQSNLVDANVAQVAATVQEQMLQQGALVNLATELSKMPLVNVLA